MQNSTATNMYDMQRNAYIYIYAFENKQKKTLNELTDKNFSLSFIFIMFCFVLLCLNYRFYIFILFFCNKNERDAKWTNELVCCACASNAITQKRNRMTSTLKENKHTKFHTCNCQFVVKTKEAAAKKG